MNTRHWVVLGFEAGKAVRVMGIGCRGIGLRGRRLAGFSLGVDWEEDGVNWA